MLPKKTESVKLNGKTYEKECYLGMGKTIYHKWITKTFVERILVDTNLVVDIHGIWFKIPIRRYQAEGIRITYT